MKFEFSDKADYQEYFGRAHNMVRRSVKEFVDKEIVVERLYRDNRVLSIGGGTTEIMKEIISKLIF